MRIASDYWYIYVAFIYDLLCDNLDLQNMGPGQ